MSAFGFGFVATEEVLTPLTGILLAGSIVALGFSARRRRRYSALAIGITAAAFIIGSKFWPAQVWTGYAGLGGLLVAAIWNMRISGTKSVCSKEEGAGVPTQVIERR
jgi:predicted Kef-type K+ transport protein